jgi:hypothetical protein
VIILSLAWRAKSCAKGEYLRLRLSVKEAKTIKGWFPTESVERNPNTS